MESAKIFHPLLNGLLQIHRLPRSVPPGLCRLSLAGPPPSKLLLVLPQRAPPSLSHSLQVSARFNQMSAKRVQVWRSLDRILVPARDPLPSVDRRLQSRLGRTKRSSP